MDPNKRLTELEDLVKRLQKDLGDVSGLVYKNNFGSTQTFNKDSVFTARLRVPVYSSAPTTAEIGDLIAVAGKLYICTTAGNTGTPAVFTLVGSQT